MDGKWVFTEIRSVAQVILLYGVGPRLRAEFVEMAGGSTIGALGRSSVVFLCPFRDLSISYVTYLLHFEYLEN